MAYTCNEQHSHKENNVAALIGDIQSKTRILLLENYLSPAKGVYILHQHQTGMDYYQYKNFTRLKYSLWVYEIFFFNHNVIELVKK
ncbi:hypothetical protein GCM10010982_10010 [Bowmanella pacifica]|uniref:Uncharacterized protein n=1 Tax=Bowmanella pacifica TaxID=502051 RepID=A0A917YUE0_9ALTE|nr:hypothetical protein GCM10010982_10010 [Bowmanella pacifica]